MTNIWKTAFFCENPSAEAEIEQSKFNFDWFQTVLS